MTPDARMMSARDPEGYQQRFLREGSVRCAFREFSRGTLKTRVDKIEKDILSKSSDNIQS